MRCDEVKSRNTDLPMRSGCWASSERLDSHGNKTYDMRAYGVGLVSAPRSLAAKVSNTADWEWCR